MCHGNSNRVNYIVPPTGGPRDEGASQNSQSYDEKLWSITAASVVGSLFHASSVATEIPVADSSTGLRHDEVAR